MKILMVVNWYTPITEKQYKAGIFHYEQAMEIQKYENIRIFWPLDNSVSELHEGPENGLYTYRSPIFQNKVKWYRSIKKDFSMICEQYKPDIIHANVAYPAGLISLIIAKKYGIPVVLTEHAPIEQMYLNNPFRRMMRRYIYRNTNRNICVSKDSMNRLKQYFPSAGFEVIYNGIIDPQAVCMDGNQYRKEDSLNCAIVAAFYDKNIKGFQYLIPAISKINEEGIKVTLHICGGGEYEEFYKKMATDLGIKDKCIFHGHCNKEKVYSIVWQMDFCVSASIFESAGVSVQEEMLLGKPILVTRSGGANSLTTNLTAIVVDRNSTQALVDGIREMSKRYQDFDSVHIRKYAKENFEIGNATEKYLELYRQVLSDGGGKS